MAFLLVRGEKGSAVLKEGESSGPFSFVASLE
jgi:hypothetical protein